MTREEALALASERKAARRRRTGRIRKAVATVAVAAFIGPFAVIYGNVAAGKDTKPTSAIVAKATTTTSAPAAVTTQQS